MTELVLWLVLCRSLVTSSAGFCHSIISHYSIGGELCYENALADQSSF
jgi:hypothetical protein